jgi:hypothetical protein
MITELLTIIIIFNKQGKTMFYQTLYKRASKRVHFDQQSVLKTKSFR